MISRRRFISIAAASTVLAGVGKEPARWSGQALGADTRIELHDLPKSALDEVPQLLTSIEGLFSLYRPNSTLNRLNSTKSITRISSTFGRLLDEIDRVYHATNGRFDPTIQPLWRALADGRDPSEAVNSIGWHRIKRSNRSIHLGADQELSFNGIAQGFATDLIAAHLRSQGAEQVLINIGEIAAIGGPFRIGLSDPALGMHGWRSLKSAALATSSPAAMNLNGSMSHILDPIGRGRPLWSSVTVEAATATCADGFSTAFCHTPLSEIQSILTKVDDLSRVTLVSNTQEVTTLTA